MNHDRSQDAMPNNVTIGKMSILQNKQYTNAYVSHVENPSAFFIQLEQTRENFEEMEDAINEDYSKLNWEPIQLKIGKFYVVKKEADEFYRAKIINATTRTYNEIFYDVVYVDYGDCENVSEKNIYPLKEEFAHVPAQAIACSLRSALPRTNIWTTDPQSIEFFKNLVLDKYVDVTFHSRQLNCLWPLPFVDLKLHSGDTSDVFTLMEKERLCVHGSDEDIFHRFYSSWNPIDFRRFSIETEDDEEDEDEDF